MPKLKGSALAPILLALLLSLATSVSAQDTRPRVALTGGLGNALGGLGAGLEYYLAQSRVSLGAAVGYWPDGSGCPATSSGAGSLRGFTGGRNHRAFLELSYSLVAISCTLFGDPQLVQHHYGPGLSLGYRYTASKGFTFTAGGGVANVSGDVGTELLILLGLGYTWRR